MRSSNLPKKLRRREREDLRRSQDGADRYFRRHPRVTVITRMAVSVLRAQSAERVGLAASGAAFWLVISAFPTAIAAVSLYGLFVSPERVAADLGSLTSGVPGSLGSLLTEQLRRVAVTDHAKVSIGLGGSLLLALWSASAGVKNLDGAIRDAYGLAPRRYLEARGRAFIGAFVTVVLLGVAAVSTPIVVRQPSGVLGVAVGGLVLLSAMTAAAAALYRFSVGTRVAVRSLLPGTLTSAFGVVVVVAGFDTYVAFSPHYTAVYGAFAGAVIGMLALYLVVYVVLLGAVLNRELVEGAGNASRDNIEAPGAPLDLGESDVRKGVS